MLRGDAGKNEGCSNDWGTSVRGGRGLNAGVSGERRGLGNGWFVRKFVLSWEVDTLDILWSKLWRVRLSL